MSYHLSPSITIYHHHPTVLLSQTCPDMSINWTGSGSFRLGKQRRKQDILGQRYRNTYAEENQDEHWFTNTRGGEILPPELESTAESEHAQDTSEGPAGKRNPIPISLSKGRLAEHSFNDRSRERPRSAPVQRRRKTMSSASRPRSFREMRDWLLRQPDWVGARNAPQLTLDQTQQLNIGKSASAQPRPAPILDSSSHSK